MSAAIRWSLPLLLMLAGCSQTPVLADPAPPPAADSPAQARAEPVMCTGARMKMCTQIYDPVCATRDTGIRCVTAPCPSTEQVTKSSGCNACIDPKVISYVKGECPAH